MSVFDTPYETATNSGCQLSDHGILIVFYQVIKIISILFFFITFNLSPSRKWISWRILVLCSDISVNWRYQHHWFITIIIIIIILFYARVYVETKSCQTSLNPIGFRVLPRNHRISSPFSVTSNNSPSASFVSVTNLVWKVFTFLGNSWLPENRFCAYLYHSPMKLSSEYLLSQ